MDATNEEKTDERYVKNYPVSWQELHRDAKALAWRLMEMGPWKGIIGIARGGLVPATIVGPATTSRSRARSRC
jgi:xanthine phosphoribosyltransferase